ncbi:MAG: zinc ribbon domain-containing protein [Candidatus Hermodarchaeota archaeon]
MPILYQAEGFFNKGKLKGSMLYGPNVNYVEIYITENGIAFFGINIRFGALIKNSFGFRYDIPWSSIEDVRRSKAGMAYTVIIEAFDSIYTILPVDSTPKLVLSGTKKNSIQLIDAINKIKTELENINQNYCPKCGESVKSDSDFCGNCGYKLKG